MKSEEMFVQLQETQESVRLAFLNCFLDFAGMMAVVSVLVWWLFQTINSLVLTVIYCMLIRPFGAYWK